MLERDREAMDSGREQGRPRGFLAERSRLLCLGFLICETDAAEGRSLRLAFPRSRLCKLVMRILCSSFFRGPEEGGECWCS